MKKPVAEVNIKIFSGDGHYKADTVVNLDYDDLDAVLATLEALDNLAKKIINEKTKAFIKNIFRNTITDDELNKLIIDIERKACTR